MLLLLACIDQNFSSIEDNKGADDTAFKTDTGSLPITVDACSDETAAAIDVVLNDACDIGVQQGGFNPAIEEGYRLGKTSVLLLGNFQSALCKS
jgi:hypothetical protein